MQISSEQVESFQADGAIVLRRLFSAAEIAQLRAGVDANLASPSPPGEARKRCA